MSVYTIKNEYQVIFWILALWWQGKHKQGRCVFSWPPRWVLLGSGERVESLTDENLKGKGSKVRICMWCWGEDTFLLHVMLGRGYFLAVCLARIWCHDGFLWLRWTSLSFITCLVVDSLPNQNFGFSIFFVVRVSASYLRIPSFTIITRLRGTAQSFILCAILIFSWSLSSILIISPIIWAHIFGYLWYPSKWPFCLLPFHL